MATPNQSLSSGIISLVFVRASTPLSTVKSRLLMDFFSPVALASKLRFYGENSSTFVCAKYRLHSVRALTIIRRSSAQIKARNR